MRMLFGTLGAIAALALGTGPAVAHDYFGEYGNYEDYSNWLIPGTTSSCCNATDCEPIAPDRYRIIGSSYQIRIDGKWVTVDPKAYLKELSPSEVAHACWPRKPIRGPLGGTILVNPDPVVQCFKRPSGIGEAPPSSPQRAVPTAY